MENTRVLKSGHYVSVIALLLAAACGGGDDEAAPAVDEGINTPVDDAGGSASADAETRLPDPPPPPPRPKEGVFVSAAHGDDNASASPVAPVKTLTKAIALAKERGQAVIACIDTYKEAVKLVSGVTMYGYYDCTNAEWKRDDVRRSKIVSPTSPAVLADRIELPVRFEGFDVTAPDFATKPAANARPQTSYAMLIKSSQNIAIAEVSLRAGRGQDGVDGTNPAANRGGAVRGQDASGQTPCPSTNDACLLFWGLRAVGGSGGTMSCTVGPSNPGGQGGDGVVWNNGSPRADIGTDYLGRPLVSTVAQAAGSNRVASSNTPGNNGLDGPAGAIGKNGAWLFDGTGFVPGDGTAGKNGEPGQGGGGGAGSNVHWSPFLSQNAAPAGAVELGLTGAGGGAGGCVGLAGSAGKGGGGSVALFIAASRNIEVSSSRLESGNGGAGGRGAIGTEGLPGGQGGRGHYEGAGVDPREALIYGTPGGNGGKGGAAGLGGHGAPGPSIALALNGDRPRLDKVEMVIGKAGASAAATTRGSQTQPAIVGIAKQEHSF